MNYPEATVSAVIMKADGKVLLCKSHKWNDQYVIPGGHIEYGEKMEDALGREVLEETGLHIEGIKLIGVQEFINEGSFIEKKHFISFDFLCRTNDTEVKLNNEAEEYVWVNPDEILSYDLGGYTRQLFEEYFGEGRSSFCNDILYNYV